MPSCDGVRVLESSLLGSGRLESGPARLCRISLLERLVNRGVLVVDSSTGERGGELIIPEGSGRGPRRTMFSRPWSCAVWCLIECRRLLICCRNATVCSIFVNLRVAQSGRGTYQDRPSKTRGWGLARKENFSTMNAKEGGEVIEAMKSFNVDVSSERRYQN